MIGVLDEQPTLPSPQMQDQAQAQEEIEHKLELVAMTIALLVERGVFSWSMAVPRFYGIWTRTSDGRMVPTF